MRSVGVRPIRSDDDLDAIDRLRQVIRAKEGTRERDEADILSLMIEAYEARYFPIDAPTPLEVIRVRMDDLKLKPTDLAPYIGSTGRVSEVLNGKRGLTLAMIRRLSKGLRIPVELLVG